MGKQEKLLLKLKQAKTTFGWNDFVALLTMLGYEKKEMSGSRVRFYHSETKHLILIHRPHPENYLKGKAFKAVKDSLSNEGYL